MKKIAIIILSIIMIILTHRTSYAYKQTKNNLKSCIAPGCIHTRKGDSLYCSGHKCAVNGCNNRKTTKSIYCNIHKNSTAAKTMETPKASPVASISKTKTKQKTYDPYDACKYQDADSFADDKFEDFFDYDDFEDEDEAYEAAVEYWEDNH